MEYSNNNFLEPVKNWPMAPSICYDVPYQPVDHVYDFGNHQASTIECSPTNYINHNNHYSSNYYQTHQNCQQSFSYDSQTFGTSFSGQCEQQCEQPLESLDFLDDIIDNIELDTDNLYEVLSTAGLSDFLDDDSFGGSSTISTPKRKYSTDSSVDSLSSSSFDTSSSSSSCGGCSPASSDDSHLAKPKRFRRAKHTKEERVVRKKDQNKKAASKYRNKKKSEINNHEQTLEELEKTQQQFKAQIDKLQTEFNVIIPLAKAAFTFDASRNEQLALLLQRLNDNNLL